MQFQVFYADRRFNAVKQKPRLLKNLNANIELILFKTWVQTESLRFIFITTPIMIPENNLFASQSFELELLSSNVTYFIHRLKYTAVDYE